MEKKLHDLHFDFYLWHLEPKSSSTTGSGPSVPQWPKNRLKGNSMHMPEWISNLVFFFPLVAVSLGFGPPAPWPTREALSFSPSPTSTILADSLLCSSTFRDIKVYHLEPLFSTWSFLEQARGHGLTLHSAFWPPDWTLSIKRIVSTHLLWCSIGRKTMPLKVRDMVISSIGFLHIRLDHGHQDPWVSLTGCFLPGDLSIFIHVANEQIEGELFCLYVKTRVTPGESPLEMLNTLMTKLWPCSLRGTMRTDRSLNYSVILASGLVSFSKSSHRRPSNLTMLDEWCHREEVSFREGHP